MMSYDPKCHDLAVYFLPPDASEKQKSELAGHIQSAVEDWLSEETEIADAIADDQSAAIAEEEAKQDRQDNGQFGVGS